LTQLDQVELPMKKTETYGSVLAEIKALQQRAVELRRSELPGVIQRIREAIAAYDLTATDLGFGASPTPAASAASGRRRAAASGAPLQVGVAKYRDPQTGKTWTGRGKPPLWIVGIKDRTPFLITPPSGDGSSPARGTSRVRGSKNAGKAGARATTPRRRAARKPSLVPIDAGTPDPDTASA
jgi:DNA-binding protein H-NS